MTKMNRRTILKLLGGAIAAGVLPKPPLLTVPVTYEELSAAYEAAPTFVPVDIFGWSESLKRFVYTNEITIEFAEFWESYNERVVITNLGPVVTKGLVKIPVTIKSKN